MRQALFDLLRIKAMNPHFKSQRDFKEKLDFSLGKINTLINEAIELDYMRTPGYDLSPKALEFLEKFKVDNAIILAAGINAQDTTTNYRYPKGMYEINSVPLVERQIQQLNEVGIYDITIVVGYAKESFEYLVSKYNIDLEYNDQFSHGNNILSLKCVANRLKNSYVLDSDIFMPTNLFSIYEFNSWCATVKSNDATNAWILKVGSHDKVENILYGGSKGNIMTGPVFINSAFSAKLVEDMNQDLIAKSSRYLFWEEIFINRIREYELYARFFTAEQILEFESLDEVQKYDTSYLQSLNDEIKSIISASVEWDDSSIGNIELLKRGVTNETYSFIINEEKYCIRIPRGRSESLVSYSRENSVYEAMKDSNLNDDVIFLDLDKGYKISRYIEGEMHEITLTEKINTLKKAHQRNIEVEESFDLMSGIRNLRKLCVRRDAIMYRDYKEVNKNIVLISNLLKGINRPEVICHGDPVDGNYIKLQDGSIVMIDWEYAGIADPLLDVAMLAVFEPRSSKEIDDILTLYLERNANNEEQAVFYSYVALCGFFWALWSQYEQSLGENFGMYSIYQYQYARSYSEKALDALKNSVKRD